MLNSGGVSFTVDDARILFFFELFCWIYTMQRTRPLTLIGKHCLKSSNARVFSRLLTTATADSFEGEDNYV